MFEKIPVPKNTAAKVSALVALLGGTLTFIVASGENTPFPAVIQFMGLLLMNYSVYVALAYLLKRYKYIIESTSGAAEDGEGAYDFIIYELGGEKHDVRGRRDKKLCHVSVKHIEFIRVVNSENKKVVAKERKKMDKYTYDPQFMAARRIEIVIKNGGEVASVLVNYDEELLRALCAVGVKKI